MSVGPRVLAAALARVAELEARVSELELAADVRVLDAMLVEAKHERKWTPGREAMLRFHLATGEMTIRGCAFFLSSVSAPSLASAVPDEEPMYMGRSLADLLPFEIEDLRHENPDLFKSMRAFSTRRN